MRVKLKLISELAGVGLATVDRVLNERGGVKPETARKVLDAARRLGWGKSLPLPYRSGLRFEILLGRRELPYVAQINDAFERYRPLIDRSVTLQRTFVDDTKPHRVAEAILKARCNALIVYGQEHDAVLDAVGSITSAGVPVVTMLSDLPTTPRLAYVGIDHYKAGRASAFFMAKMARRPGPVIGLYSSFQYRAQADRIAGFRDGLRDYSPDRHATVLVEGQDDETLIRDLLSQALRSHPNAAGIYNAGAFNNAIKQTLPAVHPLDRLIIIAHGLTEDTMSMLEDETITIVIDHNIDLQVRQAIEVLNYRFGLSDKMYGATSVPFTLHMRDNV
ncbi:LacI family DNA-binding transcriptional regulator [Mesorhizobium amorphae]|nr:LacI family DNA-binding transcriptional regulator [Mesorhizobium amorphae]ANT54275.1 transcriptional regulator [Mesorhizobium amorphae CCNWGS0123]